MYLLKRCFLIRSLLPFRNSIFLIHTLAAPLEMEAAPAISISRPGASVELRWSGTEGDFDLERTTEFVPGALWESAPNSPVLQGGTFSVQIIPSQKAQFFRLRQADLFGRISSSPVPQETGVAVTRETIVRFNEALAENTVISTDKFHAAHGGHRILSRVELSTDRKTATLFYGENLPAGARIDVSFDTDGLTDVKGRPFDGDRDGIAGGTFQVDFATAGNTPLTGTAITGRVLAAETNANGTDQPIENVTITVDGAEETLRAVTDAQGYFLLSPSPAGRFFVHIDGHTAVGSTWPQGAFYPIVGKAWEAAPGRSNNLAAGTGKIFLPLIQSDALQPVSASEDTKIGFSRSVIATNPAFAEVSITVPANALFSDNGTRGGKVGIAPVPPDRLPAPLPPGLEMSIVITVQTDGPLNFDRPAPVCFPNVPDPVTRRPLPAGSKQSLLSFNHDKGEWEAVGTMTVSGDGKLICSDPGSGIRQPGWHGSGPPPSWPPPPPEPCGGPELRSSGFHALGDGAECGCQPDLEAVQACYKLANELHEKCLALANAAFQQCGRVCKASHPCDQSVPLDCVPFLDCLHECGSARDRQTATCAKRLQRGILGCDTCFGGKPAGFGPSHSPRLQTAGIMARQALSAAEIDARVEEKYAQIRLLAEQAGGEDPGAAATQILRLFDEVDSLAGGDAVAYYMGRAADAERRAAARSIPAIQNGNAPDYPVLYVAEIARPSGPLFIRGETLPHGQYSIFVPRDGTLIEVNFFDPRTRRYASILPNIRLEAASALPAFFLSPLAADEEDTDADGLADIVEQVYGTNPLKPDSDGDGIRDFDEITQGTDPLDGLPMTAGLIASVKTLGTAFDVTAFNNFAVVAEGSAGVSIFDASNFFNPIRLAQVDTPGDARAVASERNLVAVADGGAGLAVIDISNLAASFIARQVPLSGSATAVSVKDGLAYVGLDNGIVAVIELTTGRLLSTLALGLSGLNDILAVGNAIYALVPPKLFTLSFEGNGLEVTSEVSASPVPTFHSRRLRLNAGQDLLYSATVNGFQVFSLSDPLQPALLQTHQTPQFGWRQLVPNGSGLGVGVAGVNSNGDGTDDVYLHDLKPGETNSVFITMLPTPGLAGSLSIFNGLAYVADGDAGLQIINYLAADTLGIPPTIKLGASFPLAPVAQAESGSLSRLFAEVGDDVQVRNVEFYLDGLLIGTDGNFPFETAFVTPLLSSSKTTFAIRAKATDTGGNVAWSQNLAISLVPDATRPTVRRISPTGGAKIVESVTVYFSETIQPATFNASTAQILSAGVDGIFDTPDDALVPALSYPINLDASSPEIRFASSLPEGRYRLTLTQGITDLNSNTLATTVTHEFRVADSTFWSGATTGLWSDPANWSTGFVPGTNDHVIIDLKIGINAANIVVAGLQTFEDIEITGGAITVTGSWTAHKDVMLSGGALRNGTLNLADGATLRPTSNGNSLLQQMMINGHIVMNPGPDRLHPETVLNLRDGLILNGTLAMGNSSYVRFDDSQTFSTGTIEFTDAGATVDIPVNTTVTFGAGVTVRGRTGAVSGLGTLVNQGKISADTASGHIEFQPAIWTHYGTAEVLNGAQLTFGGAWNGTGAVTVQNGVFNLGGKFGPITTPITKTGTGTVRLTGVGDLQGSILTLNATTGSWILEGGTLRNGTLNLTEGAVLRPTSNGNSVLDKMTVNGDIVMSSGPNPLYPETVLNLRGGFTLNGVLAMGSSSYVRFDDSQTFSAGTIEFTGEGATVDIPVNATVTFAGGVTVRGRTGAVSGLGTLVNEGKISADTASGHIQFGPATWTHNGRAEVLNGAELTIGGIWSGSGPVGVQAGTLRLGGQFGPLTTPITKAVAGEVRITGVGDLQGSTLALNAATGSWIIDGGRLRKGILNLTEGATLRPTSNGNSMLDQMTLVGDIVMNPGPDPLHPETALILRGGLTLNGTLAMGSSSYARFDDNQTFSAGTIEFTGQGATVDIPVNTTVTFGPAVTVHGRTGTVSGLGTLINQGKISADTAAGTITIQPVTFVNTGELEAINGGILVAPGFP